MAASAAPALELSAERALASFTKKQRRILCTNKFITVETCKLGTWDKVIYVIYVSPGVKCREENMINLESATKIRFGFGS